MNGKIKWYKREKGYGFITGDDGKDYFMHHSKLPEEQGDVRESDNISVTFDIEEGRDGRSQASNIQMGGSSEAAPAEEAEAPAEDSASEEQAADEAA